MKNDIPLKIIAGICMMPFVIYFLSLVLTVAPSFIILYAGLLLYGICSARKR